MKKKTAVKAVKKVAKKPAAKRAAAKKPAAKKAVAAKPSPVTQGARAAGSSEGGGAQRAASAAPPIQGTGGAPFRYPPQ